METSVLPAPTALSATTTPTHSSLIFPRFRDWQIASGLFVMGLILRWLARPASLWEWDDMLFALGLQRYDVSAHRPHPPGYPVLIALGKIVNLLMRDEQTALLFVAFCFGSLLPVALFYFYRELWSDRATAIAGALLTSCLPVVWTVGGMGRSDGPALVWGVFAAMLALRGRHSCRALWLACLLIGLGAGLRASVFITAAPILAIVLLGYLRQRDGRTVLLALVLTGVGGLSWYAPMVWHQGWTRYNQAVEAQRIYLMTTDSIFAANENGVWQYRAWRFFIELWGDPWVMWTMYSLAGLGLLLLGLRRQWQALGWLLIGFVPIIAFTFVLMTPMGAPFYAQPYLPLFMGLAAVGLTGTARWLFAQRVPRLANAGCWLACGLALALAEWTWPVARNLHRQASPPVRAIQAIQREFNPQQDLLMYDAIFTQQVKYFFAGANAVQQAEGVFWPELNLIRPWPTRPRKFWLTEAPLAGEESVSYAWTNKRGERRLRLLSPGRFFDAYVTNRTPETAAVFLDGWWPREGTGANTWRWMAPKGTVLLLNATQQMKLHFKGGVAFPPTAQEQPTITLKVDGAPIHRFTVTGKQEFDQTATVSVPAGRWWSTLEIEVDKPDRPIRHDPATQDTRLLGLNCRVLEWEPVAGTPSVLPPPEQYLKAGWYGTEEIGANVWRWTKGVAVTQLPALPCDAVLSLRFAAAQPLDGHWPLLTITLGDRTLREVQTLPDEMGLTIPVPKTLHGGQSLPLKLSVKPVIGKDDPREFGLRVSYLGWHPIPATL